MKKYSVAPQSICILRLSAIGDVCHAVSAVQKIQRRWPECKITWIMGKIEAQLFGDLPGIEVIVFDKKQGLKGMKAVWRQLKGQCFDYLLLMQVALRASALSLGIKAKIKLGFSWQRAKEGQWLFTNQKLSATDSTHVLDNFAQFAAYFDCDTGQPSWHIPVADADTSVLSDLPDKYVVISPAASKDERNWLTERYAQLADFIHQQGYQVVICGGPTEREKTLAAAIIDKMHQPAINKVGQTSLKQLMLVLRQARLVIAPDSGPAHLATTQGTPVIGLYAHSNPNRTGPYLSLPYTVSVYDEVMEAQSGKKVAQLPWGTRAKGTHLMEKISLERVMAKVEEVLNT